MLAAMMDRLWASIGDALHEKQERAVEHNSLGPSIGQTNGASARECKLAPVHS